MSTDVADATTGSEEKKGRGGPRGERQWREKPNARERVMNQNLAEFIKEKTGREVSTESIRAVRHCLLKWMNSDDTKKLRDNMDSRLQREKLQDKREKALAMLAEADSELSKFDTDPDTDSDEDEDDENDDDTADYDEDDGDDDGDDVFNDSSSDGKVAATFG